jgi:glycosyltransferase involved in cell wall biosynthesis
MGVGEHARLLASAMDAAGIEHSTLTVTQTLSRQAHPFVDRGNPNAPFDINLLSVNADQTPIIGAGLGPSFFNGRYTVGFWAWELEQLPEWMLPAFEWVDEVWCASRFVAAAVAGADRRPVHTIPYPFVLPQYPWDWTRSTLGLPSGFMFLFMFDFLSILDRKNPFAVVDSFERAFGNDREKVLVLKSMNGGVRGAELERLRMRIAQVPNVKLIDGYFSVAQKNAALALCDCYVSLHRSEGTGITMAEAMALGKPVIATGYSGNLDFMSERNAYLVDYTLGSVPAGCEPYPRGSRWADPDVDHAAERMREVVEQPTEAARRGSQGRTDILTRHSPQVCGRRIAQRLAKSRTLKTFGQNRTRFRPATT